MCFTKQFQFIHKLDIDERIPFILSYSVLVINVIKLIQQLLLFPSLHQGSKYVNCLTLQFYTTAILLISFTNNSICIIHLTKLYYKSK